MPETVQIRPPSAVQRAEEEISLIKVPDYEYGSARSHKPSNNVLLPGIPLDGHSHGT